jgi:hypothetical protein
MGSGAMIYLSDFIRICSAIQKLLEGGGGIHIHTHSMVTA